MKRKRAKEKKKTSLKKQKEKLKEGLPSETLEEITNSISKLKSTLAKNDKFESDFGSKMIEKMLLIGKDKGVYLEDVYGSIQKKYHLMLPDKVMYSEEDMRELKLLKDIAYDLMHLIIGDHEKIISLKPKVAREEVEKEILSIFYTDPVSEKEFVKQEQVELSGQEFLKEDGELLIIKLL